MDESLRRKYMAISIIRHFALASAFVLRHDAIFSLPAYHHLTTFGPDGATRWGFWAAAFGLTGIGGVFALFDGERPTRRFILVSLVLSTIWAVASILSLGSHMASGFPAIFWTALAAKDWIVLGSPYTWTGTRRR